MNPNVAPFLLNVQLTFCLLTGSPSVMSQWFVFNCCAASKRRSKCINAALVLKHIISLSHDDHRADGYV